MVEVKNEGQQYILNKVIESPEAVVRVFSPIITAEERAKRMKAIYKAAGRLLVAAEK